MAKKCRTCGKAELTSKPETYLYKESGLPNVVLVGVEVRRCPSCGHHELVLPRVTELNQLIAHAVIHKKARLSGSEVRFLRKVLGWSGTDFAKYMGVDASTVSNWENDKNPIGTPSDRLLRLMVAKGAPVEDYTLEALAEKADLSVHYLSTVENSKRDPSVSTVMKLAKGLGIAPDDLGDLELIVVFRV